MLTTGAMIYLADNWPSSYRNDVFMCNLHGHRVNRDRLERRGSGYVARHEQRLPDGAGPLVPRLGAKVRPRRGGLSD